MAAVVSVETVLLVLLIVLVVGLLRSHAEILRRLGPAGTAGDDAASLPPAPVGARPDGGAAPAISGQGPNGDAIALDFHGLRGAPTLLAFLTSGCSTCAGFWDTLAERRLAPEVRVMIITHGTDRESPSRIRKLAPDGIPVVMSSPAWKDYRVPGAPYFVLVDGEVRGEGVAMTWDAVSSLVTDAVEDQRANGGQARGHHVEQVLAAAGIGPEHPSLYPARERT